MLMSYSLPGLQHVFFFCVSFGGINFLNVFLWFLTFVNMFCCYGFYTRGLVA